MDDLIAIEHEDAQALAAAGAAYLQIDAPHFAMMHETAHRRTLAHLDDAMREMAALDNRVFEGVDGRRDGDPYLPGQLPQHVHRHAAVRRLRRRPLRRAARSTAICSNTTTTAPATSPLCASSRRATTVVLGLVTTKRSALEDEDDLLRRIEDAAQYVPIERLALSTQCGFASTVEGNEITEDAQRRKLALVVRVAERVWGHV